MPYAGGDLLIQRRWLSDYHRDLYTMNMLDFLSIMLDAPEYSLADVVRFLRGAKRTNALVWNELTTVPAGGHRGRPEILDLAFALAHRSYGLTGLRFIRRSRSSIPPSHLTMTSTERPRFPS